MAGAAGAALGAFLTAQLKAKRQSAAIIELSNLLVEMGDPTALTREQVCGGSSSRGQPPRRRRAAGFPCTPPAAAAAAAARCASRRPPSSPRPPARPFPLLPPPFSL